MKHIKHTLALLCCLSLTALAGCTASQPQDSVLTIQPARLTQEEEDIVHLLGMGDDSLIYDFELDGTVQSAEISVYQLADGGWQPLTSGGRQFTDTQGRLALNFAIIGDGVRTAVQSEHGGSSDSWSSMEPIAADSLGWHTTTLADRTEIAYEQEVPLVLQFGSSGSEFRSAGLDGFFTPEAYAGYEYAYAITVRFSRQPLSDGPQPVK